MSGIFGINFLSIFVLNRLPSYLSYAGEYLRVCGGFFFLRKVVDPLFDVSRMGLNLVNEWMWVKLNTHSSVVSVIVNCFCWCAVFFHIATIRESLDSSKVTSR